MISFMPSFSRLRLKASEFMLSCFSFLHFSCRAAGRKCACYWHALVAPPASHTRVCI